MLDMMLGPDRNIYCGVGRGLGRREYTGMGVDQNEARAKFEGLQSLIHPMVGREILSTMLGGLDLSKYSLDDHLPDPLPQQQG